jgi:hypothetical protein
MESIVSAWVFSIGGIGRRGFSTWLLGAMVRKKGFFDFGSEHGQT